MKTIAISDLHGYLPEITEKFDLLLICGDLCPVDCHNRGYQRDWLNTNFADWIKDLPYNNAESRVVCIAGNHDMFLESMNTAQKSKWLTFCGNKFIYLRNEAYVFRYEDDKIKIFGTPYCKVFGHWAFMREDLRKYYDKIPEDTDILISHDAADFNNLGLISEGWSKGINAGNTVLAEYIKEIKPMYYFCGHIHSGNHKFECIDGINCANVSIMNERYEPINKPLIFEK